MPSPQRSSFGRIRVDPASHSLLIHPAHADAPQPVKWIQLPTPSDTPLTSVSVSITPASASTDEEDSLNSVISISAKCAPSTASVWPSPESSNAAALKPNCASLSIRCHICSLHLSHPCARFSTAADLPSEHWRELVDCWACHQEDYSHLSKGHFANVIPARRHNILVAQGYIVVHERDLDLNALTVGPQVQDTIDTRADPSQEHCHEQSHKYKNSQDSHSHAYSDCHEVASVRDAFTVLWDHVSCARCQAPLGDALSWPNTAVKHGGDQYVAIKLYKYGLDIDLGNKWVLHQPFLAFFVDEMLEAANANASYKFAVVCGERKEPSLLIWLLNWNMRYANSITGDCRLRPAVKVGYLRCDDPGAAEIVTAWEVDKSVERLHVADTFYPKLWEALFESNAGLLKEEGKKVMGGFYAGYFLSHWDEST
ncbi:HECT-like ubiquitin-conjugating enzyme-binding-domain-containing protein [Chytriomyces sp. MP71]|nr:HECT-like ubiquitin-conjugating enzyme-binding-domain-containing protein [Chytriomyces sp. MP71]